MKVLMLIPQLPFNLNEIKGGVHAALINLLHGCKNIDINVRVLSFHQSLKETSIYPFSNNIEIHHEKEGSWKYHSMNYILKSRAVLKKHLESFQPDVVHYQGGNSFLLTGLALYQKPSFVLTIHGMAFREARNKIKRSDRFKWIFNGMMQKILCPPNLIHLSDFSQKISRYNTIKHQEIIHNAITQDYYHIPLKPKTDNVLMYIGVIDLNKNLIYLLTMLKMMIEKKCYYRLEVIGGFSTEKYRRIVMSYIQKNNLEEHVHFNGWVTQQEVMKIIAKADILVVCSKHESLPMVIAESMAAGKVVVASSVGGIPEMFTNHVSGFVFDLNQQQQLIHLLKKLYNNDQLCLQIGQSAKAVAAEKFKAENIAQKTLLFYKKLNPQSVNS